MDRGCINLSFFFSILFSELLLYIFFSTKYNKDYIHCNTWHCLHSGALTDMERYRAVLDLHLSTSGIGRNPRRPHGIRGVVCHSSNNNDECPSVTLDSAVTRWLASRRNPTIVLFWLWDSLSWSTGGTMWRLVVSNSRTRSIPPYILVE